MGVADVARLRFILSADAGGLRAGTKEATGSLKDMESQTGRLRNRMDDGWDWKGLKRSSRSLRFVGRELGGSLKGGIGDVIGIATAGVGLGPLGAALAAGAIGINLLQSHEEQLDKDRTKAFQDYRAARSHGIDAGAYRGLEAIAGDDAKFLDDLARGMKEVRDAGPGASQSLKAFGADVDKFKLRLGISPAEGKAAEQNQLVLAGEKRRELAGQDPYKYRDYLFNGAFNSLLGNRSYEERTADWERENQRQEKNLMDRAELMNDPNLKTNREKLTERLTHLNNLRKSGGDETLIGRGTKEAIDEYRKAQGGPIEMAGAAAAGSVEAYSVIAHAQMGAAGAGNDVATTNEILSKQFPELIHAVQGLNPNWRRADSAI